MFFRAEPGQSADASGSDSAIVSLSPQSGTCSPSSFSLRISPSPLVISRHTTGQPSESDPFPGPHAHVSASGPTRRPSAAQRSHAQHHAIKVSLPL